MVNNKMERDRIAKLPIKRVELSLSKFNEVAIPHHLDLLKRHKANISKFTLLGDLSRLKSEEINARRIVLQLKNLLQEMDMLRLRVIDNDINKFDKLTKDSRAKSMSAVQEYLDLYQSGLKSLQEKEYITNDTLCQHSNDEICSNCTKANSDRYTISPSDETLPHSDVVSINDSSQLQLVVEDDKIRLSEKEDCLHAWENLHSEMEELHGLFVKFQETIDFQRSNIVTTESNVIETAENVRTARRYLASAEKISAAMTPVVCAVLGGCLAGPVGLVLGAKIGGAAVLGGSVMGFTGGRLLKRRAKEAQEASLLQTQQDTPPSSPKPSSVRTAQTSKVSPG